jgi:hypothetical protein
MALEADNGRLVKLLASLGRGLSVLAVSKGQSPVENPDV